MRETLLKSLFGLLFEFCITCLHECNRKAWSIGHAYLVIRLLFSNHQHLNSSTQSLHPADFPRSSTGQSSSCELMRLTLFITCIIQPKLLLASKARNRLSRADNSAGSDGFSVHSLSANSVR